jgi:hypothetical protein
VDFAVALARVTGWLLHVDWWSTSSRHEQEISVDRLSPLRVYVGDSQERVFDARGVMPFWEFNQRIIIKVVRKGGFGNGGVYTRFYAESKLASLPLRCQPDESRVTAAMEVIRVNQQYLDTIPVRRPPLMPAHEAARFTFGKCAAFAEALHEQSELPPTAMLAVQFLPEFKMAKQNASGYFHSVVLHPGGMGSDAWGKASLVDIARRFGVAEFRLSRDEHRSVVDNIKRQTPDVYATAFEDATSLINRYIDGS